MFARLFGPKLRTLREERGLTQREFAKRINAMVSQVCRYERGQSLPSIETLLTVADVLDVDFNTLLSVDIPPPPKPEIRDIPLWEKFQEVERLKKADREAVLRILDAMITSRQVESMVLAGRTSGE